jgi:hypothetical protein
LRSVAEAVAEQRLLWHLRKESDVHLVHPDDLDTGTAVDAAKRSISADRDKHLRWAVVDALITLATAPAAILPGPNVLAYYFIFRTVGHALAYRGASHGLTRVTWTGAPSAALTELRHALSLARDQREARLAEIAATLGLRDLPAFMDDVTSR